MSNEGQAGGVITRTVDSNGGAARIIMDTDTSVTIQGVNMRRSEAEALGLVERTSDTRAAAPPQAPQQDATEDTAADPDANLELFGEEHEATASAFVSQIPGELQLAAIEQVIGGGLEGLDVQAAATSGMDVEEYRAGVGSIVTLFENQANTAIKKQGVDPQTLWSWARENHPDELKEAMRTHVASRSTKAYDGLLRAFVKASAPSVDTLKHHGYGTRLERGVEQVRIPGLGWTTVAAAAKAGLI